MTKKYTKKELENFKKLGEVAVKLEKADAGMNTANADVMGDVVQEQLADLYEKDTFPFLQLIPTNTLSGEHSGLKKIDGRYTTTPDKEARTSGGVAEGKRAPVSTPDFEETSDKFCTTGREFVCTHEMIWSTKEDAFGFGTAKGLESFYINKNKSLMNTNAVVLGDTVAPVVAVLASSGELEAGAYKVRAVAMSSFATAKYKNQPIKHLVAESQVVIRFPDDRIEKRNNGLAKPSAQVSATVEAGGSLKAVAGLKRGVYGWLWFVEFNGVESLQAVTTSNTVEIKELITNTQLFSTLEDKDCSAEELIYNGAMNLIVTDKAPQFSRFLETDEKLVAGRLGTIAQLNDYLEYMKAVYNTEFDRIIVSPAVYKLMNEICLEKISQVINPAADGTSSIMVGGGITHYPHPVTQKPLKIDVHKEAQDGFLCWSDNLNSALPGIVAPIERIVRTALHFLKFAETQRQFEGGWYESDVLRLNVHYLFAYLGNINVNQNQN